MQKNTTKIKNYSFIFSIPFLTLCPNTIERQLSDKLGAYLRNPQLCLILSTLQFNLSHWKFSSLAFHAEPNTDHTITGITLTTTNHTKPENTIPEESSLLTFPFFSCLLVAGRGAKSFLLSLIGVSRIRPPIGSVNDANKMHFCHWSTDSGTTYKTEVN